jgi:hypothetical protein
VNFVPTKSDDTNFPPTSFVQMRPRIGSPTLITFAAAPVDVFVVPVTFVRYFVPAGHFPVPPFCGANVSLAVVVPFPPFHVIFDVMLPASLLAGVVTVDDPPAANAAGVHVRKLDATVPFPLAIVVVDTSFEHTTLGLTAADAGAANGTARPVAVASANTSAVARVEVLT